MEGSQLSPNFIIPAGTHVVLKRDMETSSLPGGSGVPKMLKKAGSVGVVVQPPISNEYSYLVRFAGGETVRAKRRDLSIRRSDAPEDDLPGREISAFEPHLIYRVRAGSKAFGLADEASDDDERGIYLPPAEWHWSLQPLPKQIEFKRAADGSYLPHDHPGGALDGCWWEIENFLRLALKANPNILETLYVPEEHILFSSDLGRRLRGLREAFLSKFLYQTYSGYVLSQFRKARADIARGGSFKPKHAMHLLRLLLSGIEALRGKGILVDVGPYREELLRVKSGEVPFEEIHARALELDRAFQEEYARTSLPNQPDVAAVDRFLIEARRSKV